MVAEDYTATELWSLAVQYVKYAQDRAALDGLLVRVGESGERCVHVTCDVSCPTPLTAT